MTSRKRHSIFSKTPVAALVFCAATLFAQTPSFVTFSAPDAANQVGRGTNPTCINSTGVIAGYYVDSSNVSHGFVRDAAGAITEFTPPSVESTFVSGINSRGEVVGFGISNLGTNQSFLRTASGHFARIAPPGALITEAWAINDNGQITGRYVDKTPAENTHGFIRESDGSYTVFDDPAVESGPDGTTAIAINNNGVITGYYDDENSHSMRVFVRDQFGNFTNFDGVPGGATTDASTSINLSGVVIGAYSPGVQPYQGFVRDASGIVTDFSVSGALATIPEAVNDSGVIVGQWTVQAGFTRGFLRDASGNITKFAAPIPNLGIAPKAINNTGRITGIYVDTSNVAHGFVR
jgi:hypothetical protein